MLEGQNDYPLAKALKDMGGYPHYVKTGRIPEHDFLSLCYN